MESVLPHRADQLLGDARRVVIFTGAGNSVESGVPTFRDDLTGLWARYDAQRLATAGAFHADPNLVWGWYEWRCTRVRRAEPNPGHLAIAAMEARVTGSTVITQNVDDLPRCLAAAAHPATLQDTQDGEAAQPHEGRVPPPRCASCAALVRPGVVWFGEALPEAALTAAVEAAVACDVLLTVGTSGVVYPAAEILRIAASSGATVIQVNPEPTPLDRISAINLRGSAAQVLPALVAAAWDVTEER